MKLAEAAQLIRPQYHYNLIAFPCQSENILQTIQERHIIIQEMFAETS